MRPPRPVHIGLYELHLTPLELIDRIAALVPPPRTHRHRYFGVLAPNSPLRAAVTALATPAQAAPVLAASISTGECAPGVVPMSSALPSQSEPVLPKRAAHYLWAVLLSSRASGSEASSTSSVVTYEPRSVPTKVPSVLLAASAMRCS